MNPVGIIQPGKIGDILICLPIAKYYHDKGRTVHWPVLPYCRAIFEPAVDYVQWHSCELSYQSSVNQLPQCDHLPIYCGFGDRPDLSHQWLVTGLTFDAYKYYTANVPFSEKYTLSLNRNEQREQVLKDTLSINEPYRVVCEYSSDGSRDIVNYLPKDKRIVKVSQLTDSILDWIPILMGADEIHSIDSAIVNLCAGLRIGIDKKCYRYYRPGYGNDHRLYPVLPENWQTIQ